MSLVKGITLIAKERLEQLEKHNRTIQYDFVTNKEGQLLVGAVSLFIPDAEKEPPTGWDLELWQKMYAKSYKERLVIAGALITAELDRIILLEEAQNVKG